MNPTLHAGKQKVILGGTALVHLSVSTVPLDFHTQQIHNQPEYSGARYKYLLWEAIETLELFVTAAKADSHTVPFTCPPHQCWFHTVDWKMIHFTPDHTD